jgi:amylosucrase
VTKETLTDSEIDARAGDWHDDLASALAGLYPQEARAVHAAVVDRATASARARAAALVALDRRRERDPEWYLRPGRVGYAAYANRFGGDLQGVGRRIDYLRELGVDVLHLMSVLHSRAGDSDGGYAIDDYRNPDPRLGTVADLEGLIGSLHDAGISACLDLVMNHTSSEHQWAVQARLGSAYHRGLYLAFADRTVADTYEATLLEVKGATISIRALSWQFAQTPVIMDLWPFRSCTSGCAGFWHSSCRPGEAQPKRTSNS